MEAVGMARPCDLIRWPMRTVHGADFASYSLIQILHPVFAAFSGRSRIIAGVGPHRSEPWSHTSTEVSNDQLLRRQPATAAVSRKRYEELRMSSLSEPDRLNPNDPTYYAPPWLRERSPSRSSEPARGPVSPPASLDTQLENAVSDALWHPLDPEVIQEPPGFAHEMDRRRALFSVAGRFAAAVGVSAVVALFFVIMIPASRNHAPDSTASLSGMVQSITTALNQSSLNQPPLNQPSLSQPPLNLPSVNLPSVNQPSQKDDAVKSDASEFQTLLASAQTSQPATREQSEQLLQQFLQWRQKPKSTEAPQ
jgi:hypothetical protein